MAVINNIKDLQDEKVRLLALRFHHERDFKTRLAEAHQKVLPYQKFLQNNFSGATASKKVNPLLQQAIQFGIPLLIDRLMLGKKGFLVKEIGTWISGRLANKMVQDPPVQTFHKISELFSELKRIPVIGKLLGKASGVKN